MGSVEHSRLQDAVLPGRSNNGRAFEIEARNPSSRRTLALQGMILWAYNSAATSFPFHNLRR